MREFDPRRREALAVGTAGLAGASTLAWMAGLPVPAQGAQVGAAPGASAEASGASLPADPAKQNEACVRIYGNTAGGESLFRTRGVVYAVQPSGIRPLYAMLGSERSWWRRIDARSWVRYPSTLSFFRDLETGAWLDEFTNPLNGKRLRLPASFIRHKEGEFYTPLGHYFGSMKRQFPDYYRDEPVSLNWDRVGDLVRIRESSKFPPILPQPSLESTTVFASARELFDPHSTRAEAHAAGWNIFAWHPYLEMGDAPGHVIWHFDAVKVRGVDDLPPDYLARARAFTPRYDVSPEGDEGPTFFEKVLERRRARSQP